MKNPTVKLLRLVNAVVKTLHQELTLNFVFNVICGRSFSLSLPTVPMELCPKERVNRGGWLVWSFHQKRRSQNEPDRVAEFFLQASCAILHGY